MTAENDRIDRLSDMRRIASGLTGAVFVLIGIGAIAAPEPVVDHAWLGWFLALGYGITLFWLFRTAGPRVGMLDDEIARTDMRDAQSFGFLVYVCTMGAAGLLAQTGILPLLPAFIAAAFVSPGAALLFFAIRNRG